MTSRIYRRRPPKDGGTLSWNTAPNIIPHHIHPHNSSHCSNYYSILSDSFRSRHPRHRKREINDDTNGIYALSSHRRSNHHKFIHSNRIHDDGFTLINPKNAPRSKTFHPHPPMYSSNTHTTYACTPNYKKLKNNYPINSMNLKHTVSPTHTQRKSLFTSKNKRCTLSDITMSPPVTTTSKSTHSVKMDTPKDPPILDDPLKIDMSVNDSTIKSIPIPQTWKTFIFNSSSFIDESSWNSLSDDKKYEHLLKLKQNPIYDITSPSTAYVITIDTADNLIPTIPMQDCRYLLQSYAISQGFPNCTNKINSMTIEALRDEILKAKSKLSTRPQDSPIFNTKKSRNFSLPFVLTHAITDDEIYQASESMLLSELQSM